MNISRRKSLFGIAGLSAFPFLELNAAVAPASKYKRLVIITVPYGVLKEYWEPNKVGRGYKCRYAQIYKEVQDDLSIITNLSHGKGVGHDFGVRFLSGIGAKERNDFENKNESIDQYLGRLVGSSSRYPALCLGATRAGGEYSWSNEGVKVPEIVGPLNIYKQLFVPDSPEFMRAQKATIDERKLQLKILEQGTKAFASLLSSTDLQKLEEYRSSLYYLSEDIKRREKWFKTKKVIPKELELYERPTDTQRVENTMDMAYWALRQNLSRVINISIGGKTDIREFGGKNNWHNNTHHGMLPEKIEALRRIETMALEKTVHLIKKLKSTEDPEGQGTMLDNTIVMFGSGMSSGNSHSCTNLPILLAGGGFKHGRHIKYEEKRNASDLLYTLVHQFGAEVDHFNKGKRLLSEIV